MQPWAGGKIDKVAGIEARGFILGGAVAHQVSAGFVPILVMDVWEHAYMVDSGVDGRPRYIESFFKNVDWSAATR